MLRCFTRVHSAHNPGMFNSISINRSVALYLFRVSRWRRRHPQTHTIGMKQLNTSHARRHTAAAVAVVYLRNFVIGFLPFGYWRSTTVDVQWYRILLMFKQKTDHLRFANHCNKPQTTTDCADRAQSIGVVIISCLHMVEIIIKKTPPNDRRRYRHDLALPPPIKIASLSMSAAAVVFARRAM